MGLAFPIEATIPSTSGRTLLENILSKFDDDNKFFALKLSKYSNTSSLTIGSLDPDLGINSSQLTLFPVYPRAGNNYDFWKLPLQEIIVDNVSMPLSSSKILGCKTPIAVLDSGTTTILGPRADVDRFWDAAGNTRKTSDGTWQVRCTRALAVTFVLGNNQVKQSFPVDPSDISWEQGKDGDWCYGGIQPNDHVNSGDWLFGGSFLRVSVCRHDFILHC